MICDYCPAEALVEVKHVRDETTLDFCGHDADQFIISLLSQGFTVIQDKRNV